MKYLILLAPLLISGCTVTLNTGKTSVEQQMGDPEDGHHQKITQEKSVYFLNVE